MSSSLMNGLTSLESKYYYAACKEFIIPWLVHAAEQLETGLKPTLDKDIVRFIKFACQELKLEYPVFFMTMDMMEKYCDQLRKKKMENKDTILSIMSNILLSSKLAGQRSDLTTQIIVSFLKKLELINYNDIMIQKNEMEVMQAFDLKFILHSTLDEMQMLIAVCIEPAVLIDFFQNQCKDFLCIYYFYMQKVVKVLDGFYAIKKEENHLGQLFKNKFYIPAGIIISAVKSYKGAEVLNHENIKNTINSYIKIPTRDLAILAATLCNLFENLIVTQ